MPRKDHGLPVNAKFILASIFGKQPVLDTYHERRHPACEHDTSDSWRSTANENVQTEKTELFKKLLLSFQRDSENGMLFDLLRIIEPTGLVASLKGWVVAIDVVRSELVQISSPLIT